MKKSWIIILLAFLCWSELLPQTKFSSHLANTYSIVARDPETGEMGVAVQSHWFSVGSLVSWAEAGVGAIATQSFVNISFGPNGLALLKQGKTAQEALDILLNEDEGRDVRQLAIIDAQGNVAAYTGKKCIPAAGHVVGDNFSVQANLMLNDKVWPAMAKAYKESKGHLAERMLTALEAAQEIGGDIRGKQSAVILVVQGKATGKIWEDRFIDLRVDDHPEPIKEIKRLYQLYRAYEYMNAGDLAVEKNDIQGALKAYRTAEEMFPDNLEMKYWHAVSLANVGMLAQALPIFKLIFKRDENWRVLTERLPAVGLLNVKDPELKKILAK
ncbi:DUF1028 domain-containing protein [candidate division KSB1 bacterium]|nr:DUF1028 domain-containing protein [candidate division KSB1 bacterium]